MISILCPCGQTLTAAEADAAREHHCDQCGQYVLLACAESLPEGAGDADFDAALVHHCAAGDRLIALGGCSEIAIGRLPGSTIEVAGRQVSRRHAKLLRLDFGPSRWKIVDTNSTAGVFVNQQRVQEQELKAGDSVMIGEHRFTFTRLTEPPVAAAPAVAPVATAPDFTEPRPRFWTPLKIVLASAAAVVVLLAVVLFAVVLPKVDAARESARAVLCGSQLRQLAFACSMYEDQHGALPAALTQLLPGPNPALFVCPSSGENAPDPQGLAAWLASGNSSYAYAGRRAPGGVLLYGKCTHRNGMVNVAMADGSVHSLSQSDLERRLAAPAPVAGPVRTPPSNSAPVPPAPQQPSAAATQAPAAAPGAANSAPPRRQTLAEARKGFRTTLTQRRRADEPIDQPPASVFRVVSYKSEPGDFAAYLTPDPGDGQKHPAIIWIRGGDCNSIGDVWTAMPASNDQTAAAYRQAGIVMMFPSLRGGNQNPGVREGFFGEVNDVLAAAEFLAALPYVDPERIYLGGHSTGGTLALLVAEYSSRFRAVFSFGPVNDVTNYSEDEWLPFNRNDRREAQMRAPGVWLASITTPTFVFEGQEDPGNLNALRAMALVSSRSSPKARFFEVENKNHFDVLAPLNQLIAKKILADDGEATQIKFAEGELPGLNYVEGSARD
jgi:prepilin-type processing-associated H-X9-DG protein